MVLLIVTVAGCGGSDGDENNEDTRDRFAEFWDELERLDPRPDWWRDSEPYTCRQEENHDSPWLEAGLEDLGGSDPLSLIRYFGNGSYLRYSDLRLFGCTELEKYPGKYHVMDTPIDPTYYSLGDLDIYVDIAHIPPARPVHVPVEEWWYEDDGSRIDFSMEEAVSLLNQHVAPYYRRISGDKFRITFHAGEEFEVGGDGRPEDSEKQQIAEAGIICMEGCRKYGPPGGINRILLNDVASHRGGAAVNGWAGFGLVSFRDGVMEVIVHEIGHGWMEWPHSFAEVAWELPGEPPLPPNPYSNSYDVMSSFIPLGEPLRGWDSDMPSTLAINRYSAGWISPGDVALHTKDEDTYTLSKPFESGYQFLVIHSGRRYAFTTLEVLEERSSRYKVTEANVYDPSAPGGRRPLRYEGVLVSRYDQSAGTGGAARFGPALYDTDNPNYKLEVSGGADDHSLIPDGGTRQIGGGVSVSARKNPDGSYEVTVSGGKTAEFKKWCGFIPLPLGDKEIEYDTGCSLEPEF